MKKNTRTGKKNSIKTEWNLGLIYTSPKDPRMETDMRSAEKQYEQFAATYDTADKSYLRDNKILLQALEDYERLVTMPSYKALMYFYFLRDTDAQNKQASSQIALIENRLTRMQNSVTFFSVSLGKVPKADQSRILDDPSLGRFRVLLQRIFDDGAHQLSVSEEKIMSLKSQPAYTMWVAGNEKLLNMKSVTWKNKRLPVFEAMQIVSTLKVGADRRRLNSLIEEEFRSVAPFSEAEINAIYTDKKINDQLRGYPRPFDETVLGYRNDPLVIEQLVKAVTESFPVAHRFYRIKAKLLKQKVLGYYDRGAKIGETKTKFTFERSVEILSKAFGNIDPKLEKILRDFLHKGQIDAFPKIGKKGGAYCWGTYITPTYVLLNHTDTLNSFRTLAHEMGHAFHGELSRALGPIYSEHSMSLGETASTLFETIAHEAIFEALSEKEKIIALHDRISDNISTVMRQIACFNFELELHQTIREKGYIDHTEIAAIHNRNMKAYLGPVFKLTPDDGYFFVQWGHIRNFFYVYSYAYGMLVSKAMLRRYKKDPGFWSSIEQFLMAGGKDSPENILKEIGIDVSSPEFWKEGIQEIADDITLLEKMVKGK